MQMDEYWDSLVTKFIQNFGKATYCCSSPQTDILNSKIWGKNNYIWVKGQGKSKRYERKPLHF